ncbi:MAG: integrin alpha [Gammaproteobacteria bacterium]|nr:integrin alpha [Gammaproteobacteria bacterium]NNF60147.1 hypothetical protein [Gammaproteobacteria bacterium]NNM21559.1 hypothetical protein [Gammaproteobacteria bacterium]
MKKTESGNNRTRTLICTPLLLTLFASASWADPFPAELELSTLQSANGGDGSAGAIIEGALADDTSGMTVASGDVNGDGRADLIIGAPEASPGGRTNAGSTYVLFGSATGYPAQLDLAGLLAANGGNGTAGFVLHGIDSGDFSGLTLSAASDINDDGINDIVIGADLADLAAESNDAGESYVVFGSAAGFPAEIELSSLLAANGGDGSTGFVIKGINFADFAGVVAAGGDFNGDMIDDLVIGARTADPAGNRGSAGQTFVLFGRDSGFPAELSLTTLLPGNGGNGSTGFVIEGINAFDESGTAIASAGDVNGDTIDDLVISAPEADGSGNDFSGEVYVVFGRSTGFSALFQLSSLPGGDGSTGFVMYGEDIFLLTGRSVDAAGDVNGDGIDDIVFGADLALGGAGKAYVIFGRDTGFPGSLSLTTLLAANGGDGSTGFVMNGVAAGDGAGLPVAGLGDINNDGFDDVGVAALFSSPGDRTFAGTVYVVYGADTGYPAELDLASLLVANGGDGTVGFAVNGIVANDAAGIGLGGGDMNGDGIADMLIGAAFADPNARDLAGETYIVFGQAAVADSDGDGVGDDTDNCIAVANADQTDSNGDGIGNICDGDVTGSDGSADCLVNLLDLSAMRGAFLTTAGSPGYDPQLDFNSSDSIDLQDLAIMRGMFLLPPGPSATGCN